MISYLQEWLNMRAGAAPVYAAFTNGKHGSFIMRRVDNFGLVLATQSDPDGTVAYPWTSVSSIAREK